MDKLEIQKYIGANIRVYRQKANMTQGELGDRLGLKHNSISAIERGVNSLDAKTIFSLALIFNIKVDDLFRTPYFNIDLHIKMVENKREGEGTPSFDAKDMYFFKNLIEKTLSMDEQERERFLENIRYVVDYYDKVYGD